MEKEREKIMSLMDQYYYFLADKLPARQDNIFKTYLWLSSVIISLNGLLIEKKLNVVLSFEGAYCIISIILSFASLLYCLHAMRGKVDLRHPDLSTCLNCIDDAEIDNGETIKELSSLFWKCIQEQITEKNQRGLHLRNISWTLSVSLVFLGIASVLLIFPVN